jgi:hypothetical protein
LRFGCFLNHHRFLYLNKKKKKNSRHFRFSSYLFIKMSLENKTKDNITEPEQDITSSTEPTILKEDDDIQPPPKEVREAITQVVNNATVNATEPAPAATTDTELSGPVKMLKDAFPNLDLEIIETILQNHNGNVDGAFETLLGMSDPNYKPEQSSPDNNSDSNQHLDQMRQDEAFARQLVADEANRQQPAQTQNSENEPLFNFQGKNSYINK